MPKGVVFSCLREESGKSNDTTLVLLKLALTRSIQIWRNRLGSPMLAAPGLPYKTTFGRSGRIGTTLCGPGNVAALEVDISRLSRMSLAINGTHAKQLLLVRRQAIILLIKSLGVTVGILQRCRALGFWHLQLRQVEFYTSAK